MKTSYILVIVYVIIIVIAVIFLAKFTNRGYSRRVLSDIGPCPFGKRKFFIYDRQGDNPDRIGIVSFSLYGNYKKYAPTLYGQLEVIPTQLPGWQAVVHTPIDIPDEVSNEILSRGAALVRLNGGETEEEASSINSPKISVLGHEAALWRFLPSMDVLPFITLDADDSFDTNLPKKVQKWLNSGLPFFIFKPIELLLPMAAGRWGGRAIDDQPPIPDMLDRLNEYCDNFFGFDEAFLKKEIYPLVKKAGVYRSAYWPFNEILIFVIIAMMIAGVITLATARKQDKELAVCRLR
jgi:hypothetical protein